jgi:hypothetical protein
VLLHQCNNELEKKDCGGRRTDGRSKGGRKTKKTRIAQEENDENPWAGSLRHVDDKRKGKAKNNDKEDTYGNAPWMGTLRHVVHDNKVTRNYGVNQAQSKRYPDEDAGNPFESTGGSNSRPQFPLTPAAIINGSAMSRDEMARREEEEEVRITHLHIYLLTYVLAGRENPEQHRNEDGLQRPAASSNAVRFLISSALPNTQLLHLFLLNAGRK